MTDISGRVALPARGSAPRTPPEPHAACHPVLLAPRSVRRRALVLIDWLRRRVRAGPYEVAERALSSGGSCGTLNRRRLLEHLASGSVPSAGGSASGISVRRRQWPYDRLARPRR